MTARWSGVLRERRRRPVRGGSRSGTPAGLPTALGGQSPKKMFSTTGARERNVGCRNGFEAPRRCVQGKPQGLTRSTPPSDRKAKGPDGAPVIHFAQGCDGSQAPKGRSEPSMEASCESLVPSSSLRGRSPGCGLNPWKARGVSIPVSANPAPRDARPRLRGQAGQCGDWHAAPRGDITRPRHRLFAGSPSRWAQGARDRCHPRRG